MRIVCIGGGPAGLYFGILLRLAWPSAKVTVYERNRPDDTFGWGVVFSDETLGSLAEADPESFKAIATSFRYWRRIETHYRGATTVSTGHGFCALSRQRLLQILQRRARGLGVELVFEREIGGLSEVAEGADLVVACDGIASRVRDELAAELEPRLDPRLCRFAWLGTTKPLDAFTFLFEETEHGLLQVHAYPFAENLSTWIVECREEVWRRAGLDRASEEETLAACGRIFARQLGGHRLLSNRSFWRTFTTVRCARWHHGNVVLLGDAAHTAHFSIGSGTKLAMEDAIALVAALRARGAADLRSALAAYESARRPEVERLQRAAQVSLEWFENAARYMGQHPLQLTFNLMTRSQRITWDSLETRDPELVGAVAERYAAEHGATPTAGQPAPPPIFTPFTVRGLTLRNRIVVSPMCQYSATDGTVGDWHLVHLGSRAVGGAGLVIAEMTDVEAEGRITHLCAGMYRPEHVAAWRRIVDFVHAETGAKIGLQLAHAGRKGSTEHDWRGSGDRPLRTDEGAWTTWAPSPIPFYPDQPPPREMDRAAMDRVRAAFVRAAAWASEAGFDWLELHAAHGYLLSSFLSPAANRRTDEYGGSLENRMRFPLEVFGAVRAVWPQERPISVRISATDWLPPGTGFEPDEAVAVARALKDAGCDLIDVSSGGNDLAARPEFGRLYQVPFADRIRHEAGIPVMAVGALLDADHANTVLAAGRADLAVLARPHLVDPYLALHAAIHYEVEDFPWPDQYLRARPQPRAKP